MMKSDWRYPAMVRIRKVLSEVTGLSEDEVEKTFVEVPKLRKKDGV